MKKHLALPWIFCLLFAGCDSGSVTDGDAGGDGDGTDAGADTGSDAGTDAGDRGSDPGGDHAGDRGDPPPASECENWQVLHPEWLWCDGFELEQDLHVNYPDTGDNGFAVSTDDAYRGSYSIRQHYQTGQVDAGWIIRFYADALGQDYGDIHDEIYVRWHHKFEEGFQSLPPKMARLSSIGPGWEKRFSVLYWIDDENTDIVADVHVPYSSQANSSGWLPIAHSNFYYSDPANIGRWTCHEMYVKNNTPGQTDGAYRFWVDDVMIIERTGVDLRGDTGYNFNTVQLDCYWNGGSPREQNRYYDNLVISTQRIGCR